MFDFEIAFFMYKMSRIQQIFLDSKYKAKAYHLAGMALDAYNRYVEEDGQENAEFNNTYERNVKQ